MSPNSALVIFSGGQDSTTCLFQAIADCGAGNVQTISFQYGQRHAIELQRAAWIAQDLGVPHTVLDLSHIGSITHNALMDSSATIRQTGSTPIYTGVCETDFSGYPDCRDVFIKSMNVTLNLAMDYPFDIRTPLMWLTKKQTWALADQLGAFDYIREHTHTCYMGVDGGCHQCPACILRERGLREYLAERGG